MVEISGNDPGDYFEVNAGRVQLSSMRDFNVSSYGQKTEAVLRKNLKF